MSAPTAPEILTWRDPDGFVVRSQGRILRAVSAEKSSQIRELLDSLWFRQLVAEGWIPKTGEMAHPPALPGPTHQGIWLEHEVLAFPCYPHEITALQLYDSGQLTLKIALDAAENGWMLKDASAWNVLHNQGKAVFVDVLSFERLNFTGTWMAYGQFVRNFLLPLLLHRKLGITPSEVFLVNRDGITPEHAYALLAGTSLMSATAMELIVLPRWLMGAGSRLIESHVRREPKIFASGASKEMFLGMLHRLQRMLKKLTPDTSKARSVWKRYEEERLHYSENDLICKNEFVKRCLSSHIVTGTVLDLGCNAGEYSLLAAEIGHTVVAADADHPALSRLYARVRGTDQKVATVVLNIGRPTPAIGWQNKEIAGFLERASGVFDCIMALGLLHHLLVSERATLPMFADLLDRLQPERVIVEWVDPVDQKFRQLAGLNAALYKHLNVTVFEACMGQKMRLVEKFPLPCGTRVMYLWSRKSDRNNRDV